MKEWYKIFLAAMIFSVFLFGCNFQRIEPEQDEVYAIVMKAAGNTYNDLAVEGFVEVIEGYGAICDIRYPENATAEEQKVIIEELIEMEVAAIAIAANDADALEPELQRAMQAGIKVSTLDSNTNAESRMTFVNQASTEEVGIALLEAVYDISGGEGQWAILSATSQAVNQNEWIYEIRKAMKDEKYANLRLVDIAYGDDLYDTSFEKTEKLLEEYPDLKVICAPTVVGLSAASEVIDKSSAEKLPKVTGLGLPSQMVSYVSEDENAICPYFYLWDPIEMGKLSAYVSIALVEGEITGAAGETFTAGTMGEYEIHACADGGTEVIVGEPHKFDAAAINYMDRLF